MFRLFCGVLLIFTSLTAQETDYLQKQDIQKVMGEIFERHVQKKEMTEDLLKESFRNYFDQFDPKKIYLLQKEVDPFANASASALQGYLTAYNQGDYSVFQEINAVIQHAILRERKLRAYVGSDLVHLFRSPSIVSTYPSYAETKGELISRIENDLKGFIQSERERYGEEAVLNREQHIVNLYERDQREMENGYLYQNDKGVSLNEKEKEHQSTLHILKALARSLDSHTRVFDPDEAENMRSRLLKGYVGTGIMFEEGMDHVQVSKVIQDSPAFRDGRIHVGDRLVKVDDEDVDSLSFQKVMHLLQGKEGEAVNLTFMRPDTKTMYRVHLLRENILLDEDRADMSYTKVDGGIIGKVALHSFYNNGRGVSSEKDVKEAITKLRAIGKLKGLVLDLRDNSGGYLSEAVKVAGLFITNGVIVISKYNDGGETYYRDLDGKLYYDGPLVVLISRMTASAAEIVAQALQDYGVAVVVGDDRSFGKGSIQSQNVTTSNNGSLFKVTVGMYYTVSGKTPQLKGVLADIVVPGELVFENVGEQFQDESLKNNTIAPAYQDPLTDISPEAKSWFVRYYLPTLQPRKTSWQKMIPELKKRSEERLQSEMNTVAKQGLAPNQQMNEAVQIVKDMIQLRSKLNDRQVGAYD